MNEKKEDKKKSRWWKWLFAGILITFIGYSTFWGFKLSFELLTALALLLFFFIYDDVKEISIGSVLSIKKEVERVAKEQERLTNMIMAVSQHTQQNVNLTLPAKEALPESKEEPVTKEVLSELIKENKEYYSYLKQLETFSQQQTQTVHSLQKDLEEAKNIIEHLIVAKELSDFNHLNLFFVHNTKRLLSWLLNKGTASRLEVISQASVIGIAQDNIGITIDVLRLNNMLEVNNDSYNSTPRAKLFLNYIGFKDVSSGLLGASLADMLKGNK